MLKLRETRRGLRALRVVSCLVCALTVLVSSACVEQPVSVKIEVQAKTNQGDPVAGAVVALGEKPLGETNNFGMFKTEVPLEARSKHRIEIRKDSETHYFAPYYESLIVADVGPQQVKVDATLYFVRKPTPEGTLVEDDPPVNPVGADGAGESLKDEADAAFEAGLADAKAKTDDAKKASEVAVEPPATDLPEPDLGGSKLDGKSGEQENLATKEAPATSDDPAASEPEAHKVALAKVAPEAHELPLDTSYPKRGRANEGPTVFTIHVYSANKPVSAAQVYLGQEDKGDLKVACSTNERGRCVVRFPEKPEGQVTFVASKKGFKTKSMATLVRDKGTLRFNLERGNTVDIFAITKTYNYTRGLAGVEVQIDGKKVGVTDRYGHYSYVYTGKPDDLMSVALKPKGYLPEVYETDFVASGPMTLVRYFTPVEPPPVKVTVLPVQPAGSLDKGGLEAFDGSLDTVLTRAARKHVFSSKAFEEVALSKFKRDASAAGATLAQMMRDGWQSTDMKASVDAILLPTIVMQDKPVLELSLIDSRAVVLAAAKETLESSSDEASVDRAVSVITKKITRAFPFEGAILKTSAERVTLNLGYGSGRGVKPGDTVEIFGVQSNKLGREQTHKRIATLTIVEVSDAESQAKIESQEPRTTLGRGDLAKLRPRKAPADSSVVIRVSGNVQGVASSPVPQANVYLNDQWIGATDEQGRLYVDVSGAGSLKVLKHGFREYTSHVDLAKQRSLHVGLRRETAFLRIESKPAGAMVKLDGKVLGKTPLSSPVPVPAGFVKLELDGVAGFKTFSRVLELDQGTLDLTGPQTVELERDVRAEAQRLLAGGKVEAAVQKLLEIPESHSDYFLARHEVGEIYLTMLDRPADAAAAFNVVTSDPAIAQFTDKRFIGSHINEGIALFLTAEKLAPNDPAAARAHYLKAISVFDRVAPQLRFVPADQYAQAVHNVDFHRALCHHKLWYQTKNPGHLAEAVRTWRGYLEGSARSVPAEGDSQGYVQNAQVYLKQAQASLKAASAPKL